MSFSKFYLYLVSILTIFLIIFHFMSEQIISNFFFYSLVFHTISAIYIIGSYIEITVMQEKQGSKLDLSKRKLSSDRSWFIILKARTLYTKILFISTSVLIILLFDFIIFDSLLKSNTYSYTFLEKDYSIGPWLWQKLKAFYLIISSFNWSILLNIVFEKSYINFKDNADAIGNNKLLDNQLFLEVGTNCLDNSKIIIPERGLFQNILITGTIGTGKTSSAMYPFTEQLIAQNIGMLVLDVKGNYHYKLRSLAEKYNKKITVIELRSEKKNTTC